MKTVIAMALAGTMMMGAGQATAAVQVIDRNAVLTGVDGVTIGDSTFNVAFVDGTCDTVYGANACNNGFVFNDADAASSVMNALFYQGFDAFPSTDYMRNTDKIAGCGNRDYCELILPWLVSGISQEIKVVDLYLSSEGGNVKQLSVDLETNFSNSNTATFVKFTPVQAAGAVPEPATWAMMILGFGLVGGTMRRRKPVVTTRTSFAA